MMKMVAVDLDGTALDDKHVMRDVTIEVLRQLRRNGVLVCIATGRSLVSVREYVKQLQLDIPVICCNGSFGFEVSCDGSSRQLFASTMQESSARRLIEFAETQGAMAQYYHGETGDVYARPVTDVHRALLARYAELTGRAQIEVVDFEDCLARFNTAKLLLFSDDVPGLLEAAARELPAGEYNYFPGGANPYFVEFLAPDTSKGAGLKRLCELLGVALEQTVAFGDGENDKEFLQLAGLGIAMKNAQPLAKAAADRVTQVLPRLMMW